MTDFDHCLFCILACALWLALATVATCQQPPQTNQSVEPVIQQIKKSVVFIIGTNIVNNAPTSTAGTGFLIFVPEARLGKDRGVVWLVTCDHVLRTLKEDGTPGDYYKAVMVRYNTRKPTLDGSRQFDWARVDVLDPNGRLTWYRDPEDPNADVAITPISINMDIADVKWIGTNLFLGKEQIRERSIDENDEILFTGLFDWDPGSRKNYPIVRHGKIALIPEERVPLSRGPNPETAGVYLAEITSFGGNSGSPVFVRQGGVRETPNGTTLLGYSYFLMGVMKGFFPEAAPVAVETRIATGVSAQNSGIAMVVPASKILEILSSAPARAFTDAAVQQELSREKTNATH